MKIEYIEIECHNWEKQESVIEKLPTVDTDKAIKRLRVLAKKMGVIDRADKYGVMRRLKKEAIFYRAVSTTVRHNGCLSIRKCPSHTVNLYTAVL